MKIPPTHQKKPSKKTNPIKYIYLFLFRLFSYFSILTNSPINCLIIIKTEIIFNLFNNFVQCLIKLSVVENPGFFSLSVFKNNLMLIYQFCEYN